MYFWLLFKRIKNRIKKIYLNSPVAFCFVSLFFLGSAIIVFSVLKTSNLSLKLTNELYNRLYYAIIIPMMLPFIYKILTPKTDSHNYILEVLFKGKYKRILTMARVIVPSIISASYLCLVMSWFNNINYITSFVVWSLYIANLLIVSHFLSRYSLFIKLTNLLAE